MHRRQLLRLSVASVAILHLVSSPRAVDLRLMSSQEARQRTTNDDAPDLTQNYREVITTRSANTTTTITRTSSPAQQHQHHKPTLYLHVGPPKTATSSLQCALCREEMAAEIRRQYNVVYLGTCPWQLCGLEETVSEFLPHRFHSFFQKLPHGYGMDLLISHVVPLPNNFTSSSVKPSRFIARNFKTRLNEILRQSDPVSDALIVYEGMHRFPPQWMARLAALRRDWNVQISVAYRPLYEWLPSKYNSIIKHRAKQGDWDKLPNIPPFSLDNSTKFMAEIVTQIEFYQQHPTETVVRNYEFFFPGAVRVWPLPRNSDLELWKDFLSFLQPGITHGTMNNKDDASKQEEQGAVNDVYNPSVNLDFDRLTLAAQQKGLLEASTTISMSREEMSRALQRYCDNTTLPLQCLSTEQLHRLQKLSQKVQDNLFGYLGWPLEDQSEDFQRSVEKKRYCWADVEQTLQLESIRTFFASPVTFR